MAPTYLKWATFFLGLSGPVLAIDVNWNSTNSIKRAASTMAFDMMSYYQGNLTGFIPGVLPLPYYWWEGGAMWGALINYWHYTGDSTYNEVTMEGMQYQVGEFDDYMPQDHRSELGNDDQAFWAIAAMQAVETNFPDPPPDQPSWLGLVQAVFNEQVRRWDNATCGGGLRWQIYIKGGYNLKNTISNGCLFQIAARLARYTGDDMYAKWAVKLWDWMWAINLINHASYDIYDGADADTFNCTQLDKLQWSYNPAVLLLGAATMYNYTDGSPVWQNRTSRLLKRIGEVFFPNSTATELCELRSLCDDDQKSFKAYLARWMSSTIQLAPFTYPIIAPLLLNSAKEAASQCTGGPSRTKCGIKWWLNGTWDGTDGVGQQMSALEMTLGTLIKIDYDDGSGDDDIGGHIIKPPVTNRTGGTSTPKPDAGHDANAITFVEPMKKRDKAGAWFLTAFIVVMCLLGTWFMMSTVLEDTTSSAAVVRKKRKSVGKEKGERVSVIVLDLKEKRKTGESFATAGTATGSSTGGVLEPIGEEDKAGSKDPGKHEDISNVVEEK